MLPVSTRGRYAARILVYLASLGQENVATKREIAASEGISPDYVEQIMIRLKTAGLVRSHRGRRGGFSLAVAPQRLSMARVLEATEGVVSPAPCLRNNACRRASRCPTRPVWQRAAHALDTVFEETTIADLVTRPEEPKA